MKAFALLVSMMATFAFAGAPANDPVTANLKTEFANAGTTKDHLRFGVDFKCAVFYAVDLSQLDDSAGETADDIPVLQFSQVSDSILANSAAVNTDFHACDFFAYEKEKQDLVATCSQSKQEWGNKKYPSYQTIRMTPSGDLIVEIAIPSSIYREDLAPGAEASNVDPNHVVVAYGLCPAGSK